MKYFNIGQTSEIDVIGFYPQTKRAVGYHVDSVNNVMRNLFPDYQPLYGLELNPNSKATDVIDKGILNFGLVISQRFKTLLEAFNLPPHRFYPIDVLGTDIKYYWFHYISNMEKYIDFNKTELEIYNSLPPFEVQKRFVSESYEALIEICREIVSTRGRAIRYKLIQINGNFPCYDLFEIVGAQYFTLISGKLKEEIIKNNITGLELIEYSQIITHFS